MARECVDCGCSLKFKPKDMKRCADCEENSGVGRYKNEKPDNVVKAQEVKPEPTMPGSTIPNLQTFAKVTIYGNVIGYMKYEFSTKPGLKPVWKSEMTGVEAMQFLRSVKRKKKQGRLIGNYIPK